MRVWVVTCQPNGFPDEVLAVFTKRPKPKVLVDLAGPNAHVLHKNKRITNVTGDWGDVIAERFEIDSDGWRL